MSTAKHILIVEDEIKLAQVLIDYLQAAHFVAHHLTDGMAVLPWFNAQPVDLVVLDLMLPGLDGLELTKAIRRVSAVPIIIVTARVEELDRLLGLELGADDYVCKPYSPREVVARIKAVLRRGQVVSDLSVQAAPLVLDAGSFRAIAQGREIGLTAVEFHLLQALYLQPNRIFSRSQLMDKIYPDHRVVSDRTVDSHIKKLRKKLAEVLPDKEVIQSVYGVGYRYQPEAGQI